MLSEESRARDLSHARSRYAAHRDVAAAKRRARWASNPEWKRQALQFRITGEHRAFGDLGALNLRAAFEAAWEAHEAWIEALDSDLGA
jgi:hypothetical protein